MIQDQDLQGKFPVNYHLVLDLEWQDDIIVECGYYYVSHEHRCLFWLERMDLTSHLHGVKGLMDLSHTSMAVYALAAVAF